MTAVATGRGQVDYAEFLDKFEHPCDPFEKVVRPRQVRRPAPPRPPPLLRRLWYPPQH